MYTGPLPIFNEGFAPSTPSERYAPFSFSRFLFAGFFSFSDSEGDMTSVLVASTTRVMNADERHSLESSSSLRSLKGVL
jgi:hypothetical protein